MGVLSNMEKGFLLPIKFLNLAIIVVILGVACGSNEDDFEWTSYSESTPRTTNEPMTTTTSDDRSCPEDWINAGYLGCFYFDNTKPDRHLTWVEAVDSCNSIGGFLAEVLTEDQAEFLKSLATLEFTLTGIDTWWLGLSDFAHEGRWVWSYSGTNSEFTQWATGSPDMSDDNKNDCISMSSEDDFFWRDQPCYEKIRATPLCQRETQAPTTTTTFPGCPDDWSEFNESCFQLIKSSETWTSASQYCQGLGGNLTSIHSQEENEFIYSLVYSEYNDNVWIGGTLADYPNWVWSDGSNWEYERWLPDQPDYGGQDSIAMDAGHGSHWRDLENSGYNYFVCRVY